MNKFGFFKTIISDFEVEVDWLKVYSDNESGLELMSYEYSVYKGNKDITEGLTPFETDLIETKIKES